MDTRLIGRQMLDINRKVFDNSYMAMSTMQAQVERMLNIFVDQSPWIPKEMNGFILDGINTYKQGNEHMKALVDDGYRKMENFFFVGTESESKPSGKAKSN